MFSVDLTPLAPSERNGVARYCRELVHRWLAAAASERDWLLAAPGPIDDASLDDVRARGTVACADPAEAGPPRRWRRRTLRALLRTHGVAAHFSPIAALPHGSAPCPMVATVHDVPWIRRHEVPKSDVSWRKRLGLGHTVRTATRIVVPSRATAGDLGALFPKAADKIRVVPLGIAPIFRETPPSDAATRTRTRRALSIPDGPYILGVGLRRERKNPIFLAECLGAALLGPHERLNVVITGDGPVSRDALEEAAARLGVHGRLRPVGHVTDEQLVTLVDDALAVVLPSAIEGFGLPAVEAFARGTPVLAADRGALPEVVGEAGLVLPLDDRSAWADALRTMLADDGTMRTRFSGAGRERAKAFDWASTAAAVLDVLREAAATR